MTPPGQFGTIEALCKERGPAMEQGSIFTPIPRPKILWEILGQIKDNIAAGKLGKGDRLPSERQMAQVFGVSRTTIREAIKSLEMLGLVECVQGDGSYIAQNLDQSLIQPLSIMFMLEGATLSQVQQLRRAMELTTAALAAERITPRELAALEGLCARLEDDLPEASLAQLDLELHYGIARAAGNALILATLSGAQALIDTQIKGVRAQMLKEPHNRRQIGAQHRAVVDALGAGDPAGAAAAMEAHMAFIEEYLTAD